MKHSAILTLAVALLALTGCGGSIKSASDPKQVVIERPSPSMMQTPPAPVRLPERDLTQGEVEASWGRDRRSLGQCRARHGVLVQWIDGVADALDPDPAK